MRPDGRSEGLGCNIRPLPGGGDARDGAQLSTSELQSSVGVALDVTAATLPGPAGVPGDLAAAGRVDASALGAAGGVVFTPEVVVQDEVTGGGGIPLAAEVAAAADRGGRSQRKKSGKSENLHDDGDCWSKERRLVG